jgi:hypothetical protein
MAMADLMAERAGIASLSASTLPISHLSCIERKILNGR